jgi:hypothetical protein
VSIGNKALISAAIGALASTTPPAEAKTPDAGVGEQPDRMTNADELRVAAYYHRDKLPAGLADELLRLADEWSEEVDTLRSALTPTGSAGEDDTGVREAALSQNWLAEEFASAEAEVAQWPPGLRASFGATHGAPQPPKAETPAGVGEIAKAVLRGQGYGPSSIEVFRASDTPVWRKAIRSAAEVAALSTAPAARPGDEVEIWRPVSEADREELVVLGWWQFSTLGFRPRWNAEVGRACDVGSATHFCPLPATPDLASAPAADGGRA